MNPSKLPIGFVVGICLLLSCADYNLYDESIKPTPVDLRITAVADSSVTLSWSQYKGSADLFKNYRVYFGHSAGLDTSDSLADTLSFITDTVTKVRRLAPGKLYFFRVIVTTKQGGKGASNVVDTTTLMRSKPGITIYRLDSNAITDSSVTLRWSKCASMFDLYKIFIKDSSNVGRKDTMFWTVDSDTSITINGLTQGKRYWFIVYALIDTVVAAQSNPMDVVLKDNSQAWPRTLNLSMVTDSSMRLQWRQYAGNDFKNYKVYCSKNGSVQADSLIDSTLKANDTVRIIRPLVPERHYYFLVEVNTVRGTSLSSSPADTTTLKNKKGQITWYPEQAITDSSVILTWSKYPMTSGSYRVYMDSSNTVNKDSKLVGKVYYKDTSATINGLIASGSYWFKVYAYQDSFVAESKEENVLVNACSKVWKDTLFTSAISDSTVTLRWMSYQCNDFVYYVVRMSFNLDVTVRDIAVDTLMYKTDTQTIVRDLRPGTTHSFRVWVMQQTGQVRYSKIDTATTTNSMLGTKYWFRVFGKVGTVFIDSSNVVEIVTKGH